MPAETRHLIHLLSRHSDWRRPDIGRTLRTEVYADRQDWLRLGRYLLLGAGAAFLLSGVFFFFAYNWSALSATTRIATALGVFAGLAATGLFAPLGPGPRKMFLTAAAVVIGAVLAVLGQVYPTGANAYDFFLGWSLLAAPYVLLLAYPPLWLFYVILLNVTFVTYTQQLGIELTYLVSGMLLFGVNLVIWMTLWGAYRRRRAFGGLLRILALWAVVVATVNVSAGSYDERPQQLLLTVILAGLAYVGWVLLGLRQRSIYYLSLVGGGSLITLTFLILRWAEFVNSFLLGGAVLLVGVTLLAQQLNRLNRRWRDG